VSPSALTWRAALAACLLVVGFGPSVGRANTLQSKLEAELNAPPVPAAVGNDVDALGKKVSALETKLDATPQPAASGDLSVGETYYVRKQYKKAADTFLAGYRKYSGSDKAPHTLLRLGMSLAALGQNEAACSTFKELKDKFPDAPANIRDQAKGEAGKAGCVQ